MKTLALAAFAVTFAAQVALASCPAPFQPSSPMTPRDKVIGALGLESSHCIVPEPAAVDPNFAEFKSAVHGKLVDMTPRVNQGITMPAPNPGFVSSLKRSLMEMRAQAVSPAYAAALKDLADHADAVLQDAQSAQGMEMRRRMNDHLKRF